MEASQGLKTIVQSTKTKLLLLSSICGIGAIVYFTKQYIQHGSLLCNGKKSVTKKRPVVVGGRSFGNSVSFVDGRPIKSILKRSRRGSRRSSRRNSLSTCGSRQTAICSSEKLDVALEEAVQELDTSICDLEEVLVNEPNKNNNKNSTAIDDEIKRLRTLIDLAHDSNHVAEKIRDYLHRDDEVDTINADYDELVESVRIMKNVNDFSSDDDDSFISACESIDMQIDESDWARSAVNLQSDLKVLISKHNSLDLYMHGIEYLTHYGISVRSIRTKLLLCDNDADFCVKVHCLRKAFKNMLTDAECRNWFIESGKEILVSLLHKAKYDSNGFSKDFDCLIDYCSVASNWADIDDELTQRGVCLLNFYDIVLDFMIMDSLVDLEDPPYTVTVAIKNRWLSERFKETALSTAIWTVIKSKKSLLKNACGFFSRFYDISMQITPLLAWGFLGPVQDLNQLCLSFKNCMLGFLRDIFNTNIVNYKSVESLSADIYRIAKQRKQELLT